MVGKKLKIAIAELRQKIIKTLNEKFTAEEANIIAEYLIWAEMSEIKTQGIIKMTGTEPLQNIKPQHEIKIERDTKLSQLINAGSYPAMITSGIASDVAIQKAKEHGFGIVGVHNTFSSNGAQAYYAERIAHEDLIGIVMARSPASALAFNGIDPIFGTNPIGYAFPTEQEPLVFDMASSSMTWYGLVLASARGESIPQNMAIDKNGNPTTNPEEAMDGALLSFDRSYKGSGIGMVIEILAGPLVGAGFGLVGGEWGSLFIAIDPNLLVDVKKFKSNCSDLIEKIKNSRTKAEFDKVRLPGVRAQSARKKSQESGMVEVDDAVLKQLGYI